MKRKFVCFNTDGGPTVKLQLNRKEIIVMRLGETRELDEAYIGKFSKYYSNNPRTEIEISWGQKNQS